MYKKEKIIVNVAVAVLWFRKSLLCNQAMRGSMLYASYAEHTRTPRKL